MSAASNGNGGTVHVLHDDADMPSPQPSSVDAVALAVESLAADMRDRYTVVGERLQALHDRAGDHEKASMRRHEAVLKAVQTQADATLAVAAELSAMGRHVERLAAKADVAALGAQVGRQALDSIAEGERQDAAIAKTQRLAMVRKGAFAAGIALGTALALEWRAALKLIVSLFGG